MKKQTFALAAVQTRWLFIYILIIGFLLAIHLRLSQYAFDDAYIHFRVARNLIETGAPYFNPLAPLKVSTSSGWVIFLAAIYALVKTIHLEGHFPLVVSITNVFITTGAAIVYPRIVEIVQEKPLQVFQKLILQTIILAVLLPASIGLMETPLALLVAGLGLYLFLRSQPLGFAFLGFAAYLRLELLVLLALLSLFAIVKRKFLVVQIIGYYILGTIPVVLFDLFFYHTVVPHSIIAKSLIYSLTPSNSLTDILFKSMPGIPMLTPLEVAGFMALVIVPCWLIVREKIRQGTSDYPALLYGAGILIACIYVLGHSLVFEWYIPLYMLPIAVSLFLYAIKHLENRILSLSLFLLFSLSVVSILAVTYAAIRRPDQFVLFQSGARVKMYLTIAKAINEDYPNRTLLTSEIGGLGYAFSGVILDAAGLASSDALFFHPMNVPKDRSYGYLGAIPPGYVKLTSPDIIVSYDIFAEALIRDAISHQYTIITLPAYLPEDAKYSESKTIWGSRYVRIYIRKSLPVSDGICALATTLNEIPNKACTG